MPLFQQSVLKKYIHDLDKAELQKAWKSFSEHFKNVVKQENIRNLKEEEYQEGFVRDLFVNVLGYTLNPQPHYNFVLEKKSTTDATKSDGTILLGVDVIAVVELKDTGTPDLDKVSTQAFGYKHKHKHCTYVITSNFEKLRFYINDATDYEEFNLFTLSQERFAVLYLCLQQKQLENGIPLQLKQNSLIQEENVTKKLYADYSFFKRQLFQSILQQTPAYDKLLLFKKTQKLLDRFLFILFAEDKLLLPFNSVKGILKDWEQLKELDSYEPLYGRFKKYFGYLNTGHVTKKHEIFAYNGGLFLPDDVLDNILIDDTILYIGTEKLSTYNYESEVDVNILGHIFEHSLSEIEELQAELEGKTVEKAKTKRKKDGVFYTPRYITKYIVENTVNALCTGKKKELKINEETFEPKRRKDKRKALLNIIDTYRAWLLQLTICDPACGSGAFLNAALEYLINEHRTLDELTARVFNTPIVYPDIQNSILENNLFGVDINEDAIEIAKLSLWLHTAKKGRKLSNLSNNIKCGNSLIDDTSVAGAKAFNWKEEFKSVFNKGGFDVVIGNPPYIMGSLLTNEKDWLIEKYITAQYQIDLYLLFIERCLQIVSNDGLVSLITPNSWLKNLMMSECRKILLEKTNLLKIIPNMPDVFENVSVDSLIFILKSNKKNPQKTEIIELNKTESYLKHLIDQDFFYKNKGYVFTVEINSSLEVLINKIKENTIEIGEIFDITRGINPYDVYTGQSKEVISSKAYHSNYKKDETFVPELRGKHISRYNYSWDNQHYISYGSWLAAPREERYFKGKRILFREILGENFVCTYIEEDFKVDRSLYIALHCKSDYDCKYVLSILASKMLAFYFRYTNNEFDALFPKIRVAEFRRMPIEILPLKEQQPFIHQADIMLKMNKELSQLLQHFTHLLQTKFSTLNINNKLQSWATLSSNDFLKELDKQKIKLSLSEQQEWLQYFEEQKRKANNIQQTIQQTDKEIDEMVYQLYGLTEEEKKIVESA